MFLVFLPVAKKRYFCYKALRTLLFFQRTAFLHPFFLLLLGKLGAKQKNKDMDSFFAHAVYCPDMGYFCAGYSR